MNSDGVAVDGDEPVGRKPHAFDRCRSAEQVVASFRRNKIPDADRLIAPDRYSFCPVTGNRKGDDFTDGVGKGLDDGSLFHVPDGHRLVLTAAQCPSTVWRRDGNVNLLTELS